jgi:putative DNA primase/helicase
MASSHTTHLSGDLEKRFDGLFVCDVYDHETNGAPEVSWQRVSGAFDVVAKVSDPDNGGGYGLWVEFRDDQQREKYDIIPVPLLLQPLQVAARLMDKGLYVDQKHTDDLVRYIQDQYWRVPSEDLATGPGWLGLGGFMLRTAAFGTSNRNRKVFWGGDTNPDEDYYRVAGTLDDWKQHIGAKCIGNSRLVLSTCFPFAGPLLKLTRTESGGVQLRGLTSLGKSTALETAGSVLGGGGPLGFVRSWRHTDNALENIAVRHNDSTLMLDELKQIEPKVAIEAVYTLCNDQGKGRDTPDGTARRTRKWRLLVLSSGEISLQTHAKERTQGGAEVRMLDIPADAGAGMGIFENLHGAPSPKAFADELKAAAMTIYGAPFREYMRVLCDMDPDGRLEVIRRYRDEFEQACGLKRVSPEVGRALSRFSLLAAAGELATEMGVTGWPAGEAITQVRRCFMDWIAARGGATVGHDARQAIAQVRAFIEANGQALFEPIGGGRVGSVPTPGSDPAPLVVRDRAGYRRTTADGGGTEYLFFKETFRSTVCRGLDYRTAMKALFDAGYLRRQEPNWTFSFRVPGEKDPVWGYCVLSKILTGEDGQ